MYRAVAFAALRRGVDPDDVDRSPSSRASLDLDVDDGTVDRRRRRRHDRDPGPEVTRAVSIVAANPGVRERDAPAPARVGAEHGGGVIEGRDIGTVVFPDAELKVYLDALARGTRRPPVEGGHRARLRDGRRRPARRDALDQGRDAQPADAQADDAVVVDTSDLSVDEIVDEVLTERSTMTAEYRSCRAPRSEAARPEPRELLYRVHPGASSVGAANAASRLEVVRRASTCPRPARSSWRRSTGRTSTSPLASWSRPAAVRYMGKDSLWKGKSLGAFLSCARRLPREPRHRRPRGAAHLHRRARGGASRS